MIPKPTLAAADIPLEWVDLVREIVQREGRALRGPADVPIIEIRSLRNNRWEPVMLWSSAMAFTTCADRDAILKQITG